MSTKVEIELQNKTQTAGNDGSKSNGTNEPPVKSYCMVGYRIIVHILLIYCVIGVTYLLLSTSCPDCDSVGGSTSNGSGLGVDSTNEFQMLEQVHQTTSPES